MEILFRPIVTEKMNVQGEKLNRYGFYVNCAADKGQIKRAVEAMYNVTVDAVNTMNYAGKRKSRFTKAGLLSGRTNHYKKAIITLSEGGVIDFYSNI